MIPPMPLDLADVPEVQLTPIEGGFHVKDLPDGRCVDVMHMIFNWRLIRTDLRDEDGTHLSLDRGWCYQGAGPQTLLTAVTAALAWDGGDDTEPGGGWIKRAI